MFSRVSGSVPLLVSEWLDDTLIAQEVENRIGKFAQQPPIRIRDSAVGLLPSVPQDSRVAGAVHGQVIYLFRDNLPNLAAVRETLFHELFHYGLRKFLTMEQFNAQCRCR